LSLSPSCILYFSEPEGRCEKRIANFPEAEDAGESLPVYGQHFPAISEAVLELARSVR